MSEITVIRDAGVSRFWFPYAVECDGRYVPGSISMTLRAAKRKARRHQKRLHAKPQQRVVWRDTGGE